MKKLTTIALGAVILGSLSASAFAYQGDGNGNYFNQERPAFTQLTEEEREEMKSKREAAREEIGKAIESGDYETWKALMEEKATEIGHTPQILEVITADNFDKLMELHELKEEERAIREQQKAIAEELGIEKSDFGGHHKMKRGGRGMHRWMNSQGGTDFPVEES